ncbi:hypothetical protein OpiT1DRAFT_05645 [Opitutaceae bacterium TAV1]|nr:hypothetical protein OpiT1DRAFT_05645 [Opitutaceae bacterium TAV1]
MPAKKKTKKKTRSARKAPAATTAIVEATPVQPPAPILSTVRPHTWTNHGDEVLILKRVNPDRTARGGFKYPAGVGSKVEPESWDSSPSCGEGLHGWPWGFGLGEGMNYDPLEDIWLVLGAKPEDVVGELEGGQKCKCRHATIRYEGCFAGALALIREGFHACIVEMSKVVIPPGGAPSPTASDRYRAYLAASGGYSQLAASGGYSQLAASGRNSIAVSSGLNSRVKVGENGVFALCYWAGDDKGYEILVGKVGVDGIKADTWYVVRDGKIVAE